MSEEDTGEKQANGRLMPPKETQFGGIRGNKRNRNGRPKTFDKVRKLFVAIAGEDIPTADGAVITRIEAMGRVLTSSKAPADRALFLAYAFGKPKDEVDITTGGDKITFVIERDDGKADETIPPAV
jgi:hypothetical protein